ncbi:MAG: hypothetical protein GVY05_01030 [Bacteroidetes bacterium]|nr:hypothetical protein [Bacteroidota bacterium]
MTDMIVNFFKQSKPIVFVVLLFLLSLIFTVEALQVITFPLNWATIGLVVTKYLLLVLCYIMFDYALKHFEIQKGHSFGGLFFILMSSFIMPEILDSYIIFGYVLFLIGLLRLLNVVNSDYPTMTIFEAVFFFFFASLFYQPFLFVLILVLVVTLVFTSPHWRYFLVPLLAISSVIVLLEMFNIFWYNEPLMVDFFWPQWAFKIYTFSSKPQLFSFLIWVLSTLIFVYQAFKVIQKRALYHQKMATSFLYLALLAFMSSWFSISNLEGLWMMSTIPISIYLGDFIFRLRKKFWKEVLLYAFIAFVVVFNLL